MVTQRKAAPAAAKAAPKKAAAPKAEAAAPVAVVAKRKTVVGAVVSDKMQKTIVVKEISREVGPLQGSR
jgi:hypothetical protein